MTSLLKALFSGKATQKHANFDRRKNDQRKINDRRESIRFDTEFEDRRDGRDRRRVHGIWNHRDQ